jgi:hypothetical protein
VSSPAESDSVDGAEGTGGRWPSGIIRRISTWCAACECRYSNREAIIVLQVYPPRQQSRKGLETTEVPTIAQQGLLMSADEEILDWGALNKAEDSVWPEAIHH